MLVSGASHTGAQIADIIASKDNKFFAIDCKTLENKSRNFFDNKSRRESETSI